MFHYLYADISRQVAFADLTSIMTHRPALWISLSVLLLICRDLQCQAKTDLKYMTTYCSKTVQVDDSLLLALTFPESLPDNRDHDFMHCDLVLEAPQGMKLFSHFLQLQISPVQDHSDRLHLYDMTPNATRMTPVKGLFGTLDGVKSHSDDSGVQLEDYRTRSNQMKVDYLGKPTKDNPGFRLLVSNIQDPTYNGQCPVKHYFCRHTRVCIPRQLCCDGNLNCGSDDDGDESECDRYNTETDLLAGYSLTRDIILVNLLPLAAFIASVVVVFRCAQRYISDNIDKTVLPAVHFSPRKEGQIRISEDTEMYAPPSYEDTLNASTPCPQHPTDKGMPYSVDGQEASCFEGRTQPSENQQRERRQQIETGDFTEPGIRPFTKDVNTHDEYGRLLDLSPSDDDDNKINREKKGGKGKVKSQSNESPLEVPKLL